MASETDISAGYDVVIYHPQTHSWTADPADIDRRAEQPRAESTSSWWAAAISIRCHSIGW